MKNNVLYTSCPYCHGVVQGKDAFCPICGGELGDKQKLTPNGAIKLADGHITSTSSKTKYSIRLLIAFILSFTLLSCIYLFIRYNSPLNHTDNPHVNLNNHNNESNSDNSNVKLRYNVAESNFIGGWSNYNGAVKLDLRLENGEFTGRFTNTGEERDRKRYDRHIVMGKIYGNKCIVHIFPYNSDGEINKMAEIEPLSGDTAVITSQADGKVVQWVILSENGPMSQSLFRHPDDIHLDLSKYPSPKSELPQPGDLGIPSGEGIGDIPLASKREDLEGWFAAAKINDEYALNLLEKKIIIDYSVFRVLEVQPSHNSTGSLVNVRFVNGSHKNATFWISAKDIGLLESKKQQDENMPGE